MTVDLASKIIRGPPITGCILTIIFQDATTLPAWHSTNKICLLASGTQNNAKQIAQALADII